MHWPEHLDKIFVDACYEAVEMDITVTEHKSLFWNRIAEFIYKATQLSIIQKDLKSRFKYFRDLWGQYQKLTRELHLHRGSTKPSPEEVPHLNISLSFSVYRNLTLTEAFRFR